MASNDLFDNMGLSDLSYLLDNPQQAEPMVVPETVEQNKIFVNISELVPFNNHPFHVDKTDEEFLRLVDSIKENGVLNPILVRPLDDKYEIVSGHCRATAAEIAGLTEIPAVIRVMSDYEATIVMVHTNIGGRSKIRISEKAKAYRMIMEAEKHQGKKGYDTATLIGQGNDSKRQVYRYIRLSYLCDGFLDMLDAGKLPMATGMELAYLDDDSQASVIEYIETIGKYPSTEQAAKLRKIYEEETKSLSYEKVIAEIMEKPKVKAATKVTFKTKELESYFDEGTAVEDMSNVIIRLLSKYKSGEILLD